MIPNIQDIPKMVTDRRLFEGMVFTSLSEAVKELEIRRKDKELGQKIEKFLGNNIPKPLLFSPKAIIFRQVITPNYEIKRFLDLINNATKLEPLFFDHCSDKFVANNAWKYHLGKIYFSEKNRYLNKEIRRESIKIIDFNKYDGKQIKKVKTFWGQSLISFHKEFFLKVYPDLKKNIFYASPWLFHNGKSANNYYYNFLYLFIRHGILFENFLIDDEEEKAFIEKIVLPAFISVYREFGLKPLIVQLEPTYNEKEIFWMHHPYENKIYVEEKIKKNMIKNFLNGMLNKSFTLFILAILIVSIVGVGRYYQYVIKGNFMLNVNTVCDSRVESCFSNNDCAIDNTYCNGIPYKKVEILTSNAPKCLIEHSCKDFSCGNIESCKVIYCSEDLLSEGEVCDK